MLTSRRRQAVDDGFTLIEVIVTVAIMGMIVSGLTGVVISYLRTTTDTQSRMTESLDLQFVTAYWQRDVASIGRRSSTYDSASGFHSFAFEKSINVAPCAGPGSPLVTLAWTEYPFDENSDSQDPPDEVTVTYATRLVGARLELIRIRCGTKPSTVVVAENLSQSPAPQVTCSGNGVTDCDAATKDGHNSVELPTKITLTLTVSDAEGHGNTDLPAQIAGERRQT